MEKKHWGEIEEESTTFTPYVPILAKKQIFDEIRQHGDPQPEDKHDRLELKSSLVTQSIEVKKQTEGLRSLIDNYSDKNGVSKNKMIPEVHFPPENADLVSEPKIQKPIWFIPPADTAFSRGDAKAYPQISSNVCRQALRKSMCGLLLQEGFTNSSESALVLLTDAAEAFLKSLIEKYRSFYDIDDKLKKKSTMMLVPLERAHVSCTGGSLTQLHNYYQDKVISRNRSAKDEFDSVLKDYDQLRKKSQKKQQKQQQKQQLEEQEQHQHNHHQREFNGHDFFNILDMQSGDDNNNNSSATGSNRMKNNIVGDISLSNVSNGQQQMLGTNALYDPLDGQMSNACSNLASSTSYQNDYDTSI